MNYELFNLHRRDGAVTIRFFGVCERVCVSCVYELLCVYVSFDRGELVSSKMCFSVVLLLRRERTVLQLVDKQKSKDRYAANTARKHTNTDRSRVRLVFLTKS